MSLTASMSLGTTSGLELVYRDLPPNSSRSAPSQETSSFRFEEISKVRAKAARVLKPTRPEYEQSFGVQLVNLYGRYRWNVVDKVASLWAGLRDAIREALGRPDHNIFKGCSIRHPPILHCYMIGFD